MINKHKNIIFDLHTKQDSSGVMTIKGYGSTFGNVDSGSDMMMAGCFAESLKKRKPKMAWQHSTWDLCGIWDVAQEDTRGLYLEGRFLDTTLGRDAYVMAKEGAIDSLSIGYRAIDADTDSGIRKLKEVELFEVSLVTFPMNEQATITQVKNEIKTIREFEAALRDVFGFSKAKAKAIAAVGFKEAEGSHRDDELDALSNALAQFNQLLGVKTND